MKIRAWAAAGAVAASLAVSAYGLGGSTQSIVLKQIGAVHIPITTCVSLVNETTAQYRASTGPLRVEYNVCEQPYYPEYGPAPQSSVNAELAAVHIPADVCAASLKQSPIELNHDSQQLFIEFVVCGQPGYPSYPEYA